MSRQAKETDWHPIAQSDARARVDAAVVALSNAPPIECEGRGIVVCAGGPKYFVNAWVLINMLRFHRCPLDIQLWHLGDRELSPLQRRLLEPHGVECVDATVVAKDRPVRRLGGWELKPYAMLHSRFREVLLIDADNVPVRDPTFLFDTPHYKEAGAVFWPDFGRLAADRPIWELTGVSYRDEPEFESGQMVLDKRRCWRALELALWFNEHSDFWYRHIYGDKETFHMAWLRLGQPWAMPPHGIHALEGTMCQHDFDGRRLFQHRNTRKWDLMGNARIPGFEFEEECLSFIERLRPLTRVLRGLSSFDVALGSLLAPRRYLYTRVGYDHRHLDLLEGGFIGAGAAGQEREWSVFSDGNEIRMHIYGDDGLTAVLQPEGDCSFDLWKGRWIIHERMPITLERT